MTKRTILLGGYDTAKYGWTLTQGWSLSAPTMKTKYIEKVAGDGSWDLSTVLSDGIPRYADRALEGVRLECSEGDRSSRETLIREMVNTLDGMVMQIKLPDDAGHYLVGRVHVAREYNDLAHASVLVSATCEPWLYAVNEKTVTLTASSTKKTTVLTNSGRRALVPTLTVTGTSVLLEYGTASTSLSAGTRAWPTLLLTPGDHEITYSGTGTLKITYREAVLA